MASLHRCSVAPHITYNAKIVNIKHNKNRNDTDMQCSIRENQTSE